MSDIKIEYEKHYGGKVQCTIQEYVANAFQEQSYDLGSFEELQATARRNSEAIGRLVEMLVEAKVITPVDALRVCDKDHMIKDMYGGLKFLNLPGL